MSRKKSVMQELAEEDKRLRKMVNEYSLGRLL